MLFSLGRHEEELAAYDQPSNVVTKLWPRGPQEGNSETNGIITSITGDSSQLYFSLKNADSKYYICSLDPNTPMSLEGTVIWPMHTLAYRGSAECRAVAVLEAGTSSFSTTNPVNTASSTSRLPSSSASAHRVPIGMHVFFDIVGVALILTAPWN